MKIERIVLILLSLTPSLALGAENADGVLTMFHDGLFAWIPTIKRVCLWVFCCNDQFLLGGESLVGFENLF